MDKPFLLLQYIEEFRSSSLSSKGKFTTENTFIVAGHLVVNTEGVHSESSSGSNTYSDFEYSVLNGGFAAREDTSNLKTEESSRFCPRENTVLKCDEKCSGYSGAVMNLNEQKKLSKVRSFMDIRSQLLNRAMMQAMNKRHAAKTVGAVENIGFQDPC